MKKVVKIAQIMRHKWEILGPKDNVLVSDLNIGSQLEAEDYVKRYISSWYDWSYVIIPLGGIYGTKNQYRNY